MLLELLVDDVATIYSTRFLQELGLSGTATYTVPDGFVAVVRDLDAYQDVLPGGTVFLEGALGQAIWSETNDAATGKTYQSWRGRQVFQPGETLTVSTDSPWDVTVCGYLLSL